MDKKHSNNNKSIVMISVIVNLIILTLIVAFIASIFIFNKSEIKNAVVSYLEIDNKQQKEFNNPSIEEVSTETRIVDIVENASPAVISIVITKDVPIIENYFENFGLFDSPFDMFNRRFGIRIPRQRQNGTEEKEIGGGSGFFVTSDGLIVTNRHVVNDSEAEYTVLTNDGEKFEAEVLAKDSVLDIAVLKVKGNGFKYLDFGDSDSLKPGQSVIAIGNALAEFRNSVSVGVVSGLSRSIVAGSGMGQSELLEGVIQTDAAINPGNSGGPLLDLNGNVIGVNVAVAKGSENIGFALPSNAVSSIVESVKENGEIVRPYMGIRYVQITDSLKKKNNLPVEYGALVLRGNTPDELAVIPGSPADKAGIVENDIILEVDGKKLEKGTSLASIIRQKKVGQEITLKIYQKGDEKEIKIKLEKAPENF